MDATTVQQNPSAAFNLAHFEAADTATLTMLDQKGRPLMVDGKPVAFELYGPGSEPYVKAQAKIDAGAQARAFAAIRGAEEVDSVAEARKLSREKMIACTKSISPNFPVSPADVYGNPRLGYMTDQVAKFLADWGNFPAACIKA
jgi:hypothetical protein